MKKLPFYLLIAGILTGLVISAIFLESTSSKVKFGVTFSPKYAGYLNLDWKKVYLQVLDELKVRNLRIPGYWDVLEPEKGKYDFSETDFMLSEANKRQAKVVLVVGARQPRWPECHIPQWAKKLSVQERQQQILQFIQKIIERYQADSAIGAWQVENEPLMGSFGEGCDQPNRQFLKTEVKLVRGLSRKPIILTDSGELGFWVTSMQLSDIFGTTMYRQVYDKYLGKVTYPVVPSFYRIKSNLIKKIFAPDNKKTIIAELQAEPWLADGNFLPPQKQAGAFPVDDLKDYINFSQKSGFDEAYLWGVEWWYFMAANGYPEYLNYGKTLFRQN